MARSPVQVREMMGPNQFASRREVFGKFDSVFMPQNEGTLPKHSEPYGRPVLISNQGNFQRNGNYSSFRDPRSNENRQRKWSDIQMPTDEDIILREKNANDIPRSYSSSDYSQNLRRQRLSKLRAEFLASNLHDPEDLNKPFQRFGTRASLPGHASTQYRGPSQIYKFAFAEPYSTPPAVRKIFLHINEDQNDDTNNSISVSKTEVIEDVNFVDLVADDSITKPLNEDDQTNNIKSEDPRERFERLKNEYAPRIVRTNILESLPPTKPRVVDIIPKDECNDASLTNDIALNNKTNGLNGDPPSTTTDNTEELISTIDIVEERRIKPNYINPSHRRSQSDFVKDKPSPPITGRNSEDHTDSISQNQSFSKTKKRSFFQRLLFKSKNNK